VRFITKLSPCNAPGLQARWIAQPYGQHRNRSFA
jgi:hypothetical protein